MMTQRCTSLFGDDASSENSEHSLSLCVPNLKAPLLPKCTMLSFVKFVLTDEKCVCLVECISAVARLLMVRASLPYDNVGLDSGFLCGAQRQDFSMNDCCCSYGNHIA
jgi:hypothetical protein